VIQFDSPEDEHWVARNMQRREISKYIEKSASSWLLTRIMKRSYIHITTDDKNSLHNKSFVSKYGKLKIIQINQINVMSSLKN
jgi:hypothetical protein